MQSQRFVVGWHHKKYTHNTYHLHKALAFADNKKRLHCHAYTFGNVEWNRMTFTMYPMSTKWATLKDFAMHASHAQNHKCQMMKLRNHRDTYSCGMLIVGTWCTFCHVAIVSTTEHRHHMQLPTGHCVLCWTRPALVQFMTRRCQTQIPANELKNAQMQSGKQYNNRKRREQKNRKKIPAIFISIIHMCKSVARYRTSRKGFRDEKVTRVHTHARYSWYSRHPTVGEQNRTTYI